jgi:hypothetical protein
MLTVPFPSTVAILGVKLVKLIGRLELAVALRSKFADWAFLFGISTKVMV